MPRDAYDYVVGNGVTMTASTLNAKVGEAVTLTFKGIVRLDEKSRIPKRAVTDIEIGMCFTHGLTAAEEVFIDPHGYCEGEAETLPSNYTLLNGTNYFKVFDDVTVSRGKRARLSIHLPSV